MLAKGKSLASLTLSLLLLGGCGVASESVKDSSSDSTPVATSESELKEETVVETESVVEVERDENGIPVGYSADYLNSEPLIANGYVLDNSMLNEVKLSGLMEKLENKETFVLYIGRDTCKWCHYLRQTQDFVLKDLGEKVVYLNSEVRDELTQKEFDLLVDKLGIVYVPYVVVIKDGEVLKGSGLPAETLKKPDYDSVKAFYENAFNTVNSIEEGGK